MNNRNRPKRLIICGFPGVGKSYVANKFSFDKFEHNNKFYNNYENPDIIDLESSNFSKSNFPKNYVDRIEELFNEESPKIILTSTHDSVLDELNKRKLPHIIVVPNPELNRKEYLLKYLKRNDTLSFIKNIDYHWCSWIKEICNRYTEDNTIIIELDKGESLMDIITRII